MRRRSAKQQAYLDSIREDRAAWAMEQEPRCMYCGGTNILEVHEIARKSSARRQWAHRCNYLLLDRRCHEGLFASADHAFQLAVKLVRDPEHFDLPKWIEIIGRAETYVELADVARHLKLVS